VSDVAGGRRPIGLGIEVTETGVPEACRERQGFGERRGALDRARRTWTGARSRAVRGGGGQGASDADQTTSDADQTASERDEADAISDQLVADLEQAHAKLRGPSDDPQAAERRTTRASRATRRGHAGRSRTPRGPRPHAPRLGQPRVATRPPLPETRTARAAGTSAHERPSRRSRNPTLPLAEKLERLRIQAQPIRARAAADSRAGLPRTGSWRRRERALLEAALHNAYVDELTGALRRKLGMLALGHEVDRARRGDGRLVCAFVDVDDLKHVNDRDGHAAGDRVAQGPRVDHADQPALVRPIVRYGGDEFVCGLGAAEVSDVERRFELINRSLWSAVDAGISVGIASLAEDETLDDVLARADAALLATKQARGA